MTLDVDAVIRTIADKSPLSGGSPATVVERLIEDWALSWGSRDDAVSIFNQAVLRAAQARVDAAAKLAADEKRP